MTQKDYSFFEAAAEGSLYTPQPYLNRRAWEKQMLSFISLGNPELLNEYYRQVYSRRPPVAIGTMSREALTQAKYLCVAVVAMSCRTAIDAGVPEHIAFAVSDALIQEADQMHHPELLTEQMEKAVRRYCIVVAQNRLEHTSSPVRQCCEYMMLQLYGTVTLKDLSGVCHLSEHYISDLFRKELGVGALAYFNRLKMDYARHLVLHSQLSITQIATRLSYPSASNFTQRFRRTFGTTPLAYRKNPPQ